MSAPSPGKRFSRSTAGTRNHFALDLGLDRDDVVGALDAFTDAVERRIDLACVNGRVFVNNAASPGSATQMLWIPGARLSMSDGSSDFCVRRCGACVSDV
jgi:hypothetical protein